MQLTRLAEDYSKIKEAGADLIAISADTKDYAWSMGLAIGAKFQILSDSDHKVIESFGVLNAKEHGGIAHPSTFIIGKDGRILYAYVGKDPGDRPEDDAIINELKKISAAKQ
jgi:peroxiredoxin